MARKRRKVKKTGRRRNRGKGNTEIAGRKNKKEKNKL